jgi:hypothetical protein
MMKILTTHREALLRRSVLPLVATVVLGLCLVVVAPSQVAAQTPDLVTDRPDQTESTSIVPRGYVQLETGGLVAAEGSGRAQQWGASVLRVGVAGPLEFRLGWAGWQRVTAPSQPAVSGVGDLNLGVKYRIVGNATSSTSVALLGTVGLPTGTSAFRASRIASSIRVAVAHAVGPRVGVGSNVAVTATSPRSGIDGVRLEDVAYTVVVGVAVTERLGVFVESFGTLAVATVQQTRHALDAGITIAVLPLLQLDMSGGIGLNGAADDWFVGAGLSILVGG